MKIEIDKPVVPRFVADWIEQLYGQGFNSDDLLEALFTRNYDMAEFKIFRWFLENKNNFIIAVIYGYEIKKRNTLLRKNKRVGSVKRGHLLEFNCSREIGVSARSI